MVIPYITKIKKMKKIIFIIFILFFFFGTELYLVIKKPTPYLYDYELGWTAKKDFKHTYEQKDLYGNRYSAAYLTNNLGARPFIHKSSLNNNNQSVRILVVGDSFTMDPHVSNEDIWYSILAKKLSKNNDQNVEVLAFGAGAYGTLQQLLLLQRHKVSIDNFSPNIFILQFCSNDFANNSLNIEKASFSLSQYMRRPYFANNKIYYHDSFLSYFFKKNTLTRESRLFSKSTFLFELFIRKFFLSNINLPDNYIIEARDITQNLLIKIRKLYPNAKSFIFSCSNKTSDLSSSWKQLAKNSNFIILDQSSDFIDKAVSSNQKIFHKDGGHLNILGNLLWGELIYNEINNKN